MADAQKVKVRVLVESDYGKPNDVGEVDAKLVKGLVGVVDADPDAVTYAESLAQD